MVVGVKTLFLGVGRAAASEADHTAVWSVEASPEKGQREAVRITACKCADLCRAYAL